MILVPSLTSLLSKGANSDSDGVVEAVEDELVDLIDLGDTPLQPHPPTTFDANTNFREFCCCGQILKALQKCNRSSKSVDQ